MRRRVAAADAAEPAAHQTSPPPTWTFVWAWARTRGERRVFPQLDLLASPADPVLTQEEYVRLEADWRAAGSPRDFEPRGLLSANLNPARREEVPS